MNSPSYVGYSRLPCFLSSSDLALSHNGMVAVPMAQHLVKPLVRVSDDHGMDVS
jgi:hypothetical protein